MPTPAPALGSECTRTEEWIALLGRRDAPTDGVEDYCTFLAAALAQQGVEMKIVRVPWAEEGWFRALRHLWRESAGWRDHWVLLQYTAMGWSRRGFPLGVLAALTVLRWRGVRTAVIFHDPFRQGGQRWIHHLRGVFQDWIVRRLYGGATKAIFADPLETLRWLPKNDSKSVFIPIGANIPEQRRELSSAHNGNAKTVAIFCLSDPPNRERELAEIAHAVRYAAKNGLNARVVFMGRGTPEASEDILRAFHTVPVEVTNLGLQPANELSRILSESDAMLCVRGPLYPRRGSAIAAIACGLPIIAYAGAAEGTPIAEAGVELVPYTDREALGIALARVLADHNAWSQLHEKSELAHRRYFSWNVVAPKMHQSLSAEPRAQK
jgi:glycosyltransferase involved in cell wall biosynthesis